MSMIGFLGPEYTFSERAARYFANGERLISCNTIGELYDGLTNEKYDLAVSPFENSAAGYVPAALEAIRALRRPLYVLGERNEEIRFSLYRRRGDETAPLKRVISHLMSLKQCDRWIGERGIGREEVGSNGVAFLAVRDSREPGLGAIGPTGIQSDTMIETETDLQGRSFNLTRFLLLSRAAPARKTGAVFCEVENIAHLAQAKGAASIHAAGPPLPQGSLGSYRHLLEVLLSDADDAAEFGMPSCRPLIFWARKD